MTHITDKAENIVAPATVPGSGAVGIIRLSGPDVITIADSILAIASHTRGKRPTLKSTDSYRMRFARISDVDEVLAVPFRAPNSYTGENCVELYCHASSFIMSKIQMMLIDSAKSLFKESVPEILSYAAFFRRLLIEEYLFVFFGDTQNLFRQRIDLVKLYDRNIRIGGRFINI